MNCLAVAFLLALGAEPRAEYVPKLGEFPPADVGVYHMGQLVTSDPINRRGALGLVGNRDLERHHDASPQPFQLLPYAIVRYHGAPAELRDIPTGTVLHAYCVLPPNYSPEGKKPRLGAYVVPQDHAISLEDSFSFYERRGQAWEIEAVEPDKLKVVSTGKAEGDGPIGKQTFHYDASTRVWKGKQIGTVADLAPGQTVQLNFTWDANWIMGGMHISDVWVDEVSRATASEHQRQIHIRYLRYHWLPGWVDHVEDQGDGKGIVTVSLFSNGDPSLYQQLESSKTLLLGVSDLTLRTWLIPFDAKGGPLLDVKTLPEPPFGHSGLTIRVSVTTLLEGFRPGRVVRVRPDGFPYAKLPPEERLRP